MTDSPWPLSHGEDIRVAGFCAGSNLIVGARKRIDGLRLRATDANDGVAQLRARMTTGAPGAR
jgi:hypothetical protein